MSWYKDFKSFLLRGNVVDTAIGVIIGVVVGNVVNSLVNDILMPPIGLFLSGIDFSQLAFKVALPGMPDASVEIRYGAFLNVFMNFIIVSWVIFLIVKLMARLHLSNEDKLSPPRYCPACQMIIPQKAIKCGHCCTDLSIPGARGFFVEKSKQPSEHDQS